MPDDETNDVKEKVKKHIVSATVHSKGVVTKSATMEEGDKNQVANDS